MTCIACGADVSERDHKCFWCHLDQELAATSTKPFWYVICKNMRIGCGCVENCETKEEAMANAQSRCRELFGSYWAAYAATRITLDGNFDPLLASALAQGLVDEMKGVAS